MDLQELDKLEKGKKILGKIDSARKQIVSAEQCDRIKIFGLRDRNISGRIDIDFTADHPFYSEAKKFIDSYISYLEKRIIDLEIEFKEL